MNDFLYTILGLGAPLLKDYSSEDVIITWGGVVLRGFSDQMMELEYQDPVFSHKRGIDGSVAHTGYSPSTAVLRVYLEYGSEDNSLLSDIMTVQTKLNFPLPRTLLVIYNSKTVIRGVNAYLRRPVDQNFAKTHESMQRTWEFVIEEVVIPESN